MERLDKLFKDQLLKHEESPTPQAWDQIHGRLASKRRKSLGKKLAIAASILLFATAGYIGYQSLDSLTIKKDQLVVKAMDDNSINEEQSIIEEQSIPKPEEAIVEINNSDDNAKAPTIEVREQNPDRVQAKSAEILTKEPSEVDLPIVGTEEKIPVMTKVESDEGGIDQKIKTDETIKIIEEPVLPDPSEEILLAENITMGEAEERLEKEEKKKTYTQVKIIYKADENSELVSSNKKTLIDKGIDKLTKFSNERLITEDRKTKLRNTKEDLLALNIGKLLNKSNKEGI